MQKFVAAAAAFALAPFAVQAQDHSGHAGHAGHADHAAPAAAAATGKLTLDSPVEAIVAKPEGKAVLEASLPGITTHEHYPMFKAMSLKQIAAMAPDKLTPETLAKVEVGLAALK